MNPDVQFAIRCADFYRQRGYQPLPSQANGRAPNLAAYTDLWEAPFPKAEFDRRATANIQMMCGVRWNLIVLDLDGKTAARAFWRLCAERGVLPPTWRVRTPGGGYHLWFRPHRDQLTCVTGKIWGLWDPLGGRKGDGGWIKHTAIEILGERHLVTVPPSRRDHTPYRWVDGRSPRDLDQPAEFPEWLDAYPRLPARLAGVVPSLPIGSPSLGLSNLRLGPGPDGDGTTPVRRPSTPWDGKRYRRRDVIEAIHRSGAIFGVAERFGVVFKSTDTNAAGWCPCYAVTNRGVPGHRSGDSHPSAMFEPDTGCYKEFYAEFGPKISLFDLAVLTGHHADWRDACNALGAEFGAPLMP
jgi:hypothetical protein